MDTTGKPIKKGKLTVFLGSVAGVGKTYAMLEAGYDKYMHGNDAVVGCIDMPKKTDLATLLCKIPILLKGEKAKESAAKIAELDIDAVLDRKPQLVIIDNLAHLNDTAYRHSYRYQDVQEILDFGIDVYTTMDIFHVESLKDIVEQITGIKGQHTVPDGFIEKAELILIDVSQDEIIQRIKDEKIILPQELGQNTDDFFRPGNINALRELALRYTAQRVDKQLSEYMQEHDIKGPWPASERILACISPSPFSTQVIRAARRMADALKAEWAVIYVETHYHSPQNEVVYNQLAKNLLLAEELGAEIITLTGDDFAQEILLVSKRKNITQIVLGKPAHSRIEELRGSVVDRVLRESQGISVHIIPGKSVTKEKQSIAVYRSLRQCRLFPYTLTLLLVVLITLINKYIGFDLPNIVLLYLLPVLFSGAYWGRGPSIMASLLGVLAFDILFVPPIHSITVADLKYF
jgi:two-component system sensor histidine kinase KdpD